MTIVSIKGLWVCRAGHAVLEDINLELEAADFLGLIGPNGGGKSTLLKVLLGLIKPDRGEIRIFGLTPEAARGRVGYMPQKTVFDQSFPVKVLDVVLMGRYTRTGLFHRYGADDRNAAHRALEAVGMEDRAETGDRRSFRWRAAEGLCGQFPGFGSRAALAGRAHGRS